MENKPINKFSACGMVIGLSYEISNVLIVSETIAPTRPLEILYDVCMCCADHVAVLQLW